MSHDLSDRADPSPEDLAAIEAEWPLIAAELDLVDAEIAALAAGGGPSVLDRRRLRRAESRVMRVAAALGVAAVMPVRLAA
ncbi:DUF6284 family protein [Solwaraspora sp. WMMD791]|uniref:DUF6284 family protein n=1 Tax=Solwaraspora sp. WMMD791 TaxID=3016086 RepID=UPI00249CBBF8|nr:DUF6284 family protein [Solwaraspora sp. WMMD791]WFE27810.1 DUF6284 family protein [Solwaraspora sp. WMMD791]